MIFFILPHLTLSCIQSSESLRFYKQPYNRFWIIAQADLTQELYSFFRISLNLGDHIREELCRLYSEMCQLSIHLLLTSISNTTQMMSVNHGQLSFVELYCRPTNQSLLTLRLPTVLIYSRMRCQQIKHTIQLVYYQHYVTILFCINILFYSTADSNLETDLKCSNVR